MELAKLSFEDGEMLLLITFGHEVCAVLIFLSYMAFIILVLWISWILCRNILPSVSVNPSVEPMIERLTTSPSLFILI